MNWKNPAVDQAIIDARAELDPVRRHACWKIILDQCANGLPEIPLCFPASGLITPKWMTGI